MTASPVRDFVVGLFVLGGLGAIAYLSFSVGGLSYRGPVGMQLVAKFDEIGGLRVRAPVVIAGVKVGQVKQIDLDPDTSRARVVLDVDPTLKLPIDTTAAIRTSGVLGDKFLALEPGAEEETLKPGEEIGRTESALSLENLINKFVVNSGEEKSKK
ncbi:MAG TPA: outer membrane lipid asymmetry maintenance protein MlaD [Myxococcota bacterium]|jgi:phospholipid/cholesterol/gamma-HCH transport system substrate-binding protein|nr:outer membrane lipid asymmetry maintenance protein MlaD [Myxococcota bacterium]